MAITIRRIALSYLSFQIYEVNFHGDVITALVTSAPCIVDTWISDMQHVHEGHHDGIFFRLDIKWDPKCHGRPGTLELCIGRNCLIIRFKHMVDENHDPIIPPFLRRFLDNPSYKFVEMGIDAEMMKLPDWYGSKVRNTVDLQPDSSTTQAKPWLTEAGLERLAREVLRKEINKPWIVKSINWRASR